MIDALKSVSFSIKKGTPVSFVGPSGSGKTTLLNLIGCLDRPSNGRLLVTGMEVSGLTPRDAARFRGKYIGFVFQSFNLIPVLTAYENVEYPLIMVQGTSAAKRRNRVLELLEAVDMIDQKDKLPDQLSGGQKQRVAIARALVANPNLVLADEPPPPCISCLHIPYTSTPRRPCRGKNASRYIVWVLDEPAVSQFS